MDFTNVYHDMSDAQRQEVDAAVVQALYAGFSLAESCFRVLARQGVTSEEALGIIGDSHQDIIGEYLTNVERTARQARPDLFVANDRA